MRLCQKPYLWLPASFMSLNFHRYNKALLHKVAHSVYVTKKTSKKQANNEVFQLNASSMKKIITEKYFESSCKDQLP